MKHPQHISSFYLQFLVFNLCFLGLQLVLAYSERGSFISAIHLPEKIYLELIATLIIHIGLYSLLSLIQTLILLGVLNRSWHYFSIEQWLLIIWVLFVCSILSANAYYFPLSIFSKLFSPPLSEFYIKFFFFLSLFCIGILLLNCLFYRKNIRFFILIIPLLLCYIVLNYYFKPISYKNKNTKPNIIILGIDSLSPESINEENMPFFNKLINNSTRFANTVSPLARTYPAWTTILTGLYPEHHHAEENLIAKSSVKSQSSIAWILDKQGYNTIFATDDRRFNSIDKDFGFKTIIGPKLGVNDVLLGSFNDFPLSNLLINCRISAWLFPYNYISRASYFSYYPKTFSKKLQDELSIQQHNSPLFLAVHFTLPHWPYAWAESLPEQVNNEFSLEKRETLYQSSLTKVDKQFHLLFTYLEKNHYFDNSLVIILSDHGEALYYPNSRLTNYQNYQGTPPSRFAQYLEKNTATVLNKSAGHGSDILSPKQYHSVLAFNIYKNGYLTTTNNVIKTRTALTDIAPTILAFLNLTNKQNMDGVSLLKTIINPREELPQRSFFIESGMFPNQLLSKEKAIEIGQLFYDVNPNNGELEIKPTKLKDLSDQKLYGVIEGDWVLALYPDDKTYIPVIQNLITGQWSDDLHSNFSKSTPAAKLVRQLQQFYGNKLFLPLP